MSLYLEEARDQRGETLGFPPFVLNDISGEILEKNNSLRNCQGQACRGESLSSEIAPCVDPGT